jgi:uncharacterized protein
MYDSPKARLMSVETARAAADYAVRQAGKTLDIRLFGGEPLLNMPAIREIISRANELATGLAKRVSFSLSTNGLLLTEEIATYLKAHHVMVSISMDGDESVTNRHRKLPGGKGAYDQIYRGLRTAQSAGLAVATRSVLGAKDAADWRRHVNGLVEKGFVSIDLQFVRDVGHFGKKDEIAVGVQEQLSIIDQCIERLAVYYQAHRELPSIEVSEVMKIVNQLLAVKHKRRSCAAGIRTMAVGVQGEIYPCTAFSMGLQGSIGHVCDAVDEPLDATWLPSVEEIPDCQSCFLKYACLGGCYGTSWEDNGRSLLRQPPDAASGIVGNGSCASGESCGSRTSCASRCTSTAFLPPEDKCTIRRHAYRKVIALFARLNKHGFTMGELRRAAIAGEAQ